METPPSYPLAASQLSPPGVLGVGVGAIRVVASVLLLTVACILVLIGAVIPGRWKGAGASMWVVWVVCRTFLLLNRVRLDVTEAETLTNARGFVFFNHVSYLDIPVLLAARPLRFLATAGVRRIPFIGWMARAVGTVFVHRGDGASREAARGELAAAFQRSPTPIALAPEGGVQHGPYVRPFRHGAFEVAAEAEAPVLLVALDFAPRGYAAWVDGESLLAGYWRLASRTAPLVARIVALPPAETVNGVPAVSAQRAEVRINEALEAIWSVTPPRPAP
ncbi:MAG: lysophospholipid acyltransferase family protein [Bacteroidota bacterium]